MIYCSLVGGLFNHLEKYEFVNGKDLPILWKIKCVWNHQQFLKIEQHLSISISQYQVEILSLLTISTYFNNFLMWRVWFYKRRKLGNDVAFRKSEMTLLIVSPTPKLDYWWVLYYCNTSHDSARWNASSIAWISGSTTSQERFQQALDSDTTLLSYWKWRFIVDFPIKNGDFPIVMGQFTRG